jgi:hypothetical protein
MPRRTLRKSVISFLSVSLLLFVASSASAQGATPPAKAGQPVAPAVLEKLLPAPDGWTRSAIRASEVEISPECRYTAACVSLARDDMRVKITLADTSAKTDALIALASLVVTLPEDCVQEIPPATTITRLKAHEMPAAEMWDAEELSGEITLLINDRFVVTVEAQKADSLETLRALLASVDLKALGALK